MIKKRGFLNTQRVQRSIHVKGAILFILILLLAVTTGCKRETRGTASTAGKTTIIVADAKTTHHLNLYVAKELGIFEKYNLDVQITAVDDNAAARDLAVSGAADVFWSCSTVAIAAIANGASLKIISQVKVPCTSVLVVPQDSLITKLTDLNGKEIAGISPTCEAVISLTVAVRKEGAAFNLNRLAGGPAISALQAGRVA